jgi:hypothetical protein
MSKLDGDVDDRFGFGVEYSIRHNGSNTPIREISVHYVVIKGLFAATKMGDNNSPTD